MRVHGNLDGHAPTLACAVIAIAAPTLVIHLVVQVGVRWHVDGDAPVAHIEVTPITSPAAAGSIQIAVCRHDYGHAGVPDTPIATHAIPTASVAILPRMVRHLARSSRDGQRSTDSKSQQ